jgi:hypothetical protein
LEDHDVDIATGRLDRIHPPPGSWSQRETDFSPLDQQLRSPTAKSNLNGKNYVQHQDIGSGCATKTEEVCEWGAGNRLDWRMEWNLRQRYVGTQSDLTETLNVHENAKSQKFVIENK